MYKYYSFIPHSFGRNRPPLLNSIIMLKHEIGLLESLSDLKAAADILKSDVDTSGMHELDRQFHGLNLKEMTPLDPSSTEFKTLTAYLNKSTGATHRLEYAAAPRPQAVHLIYAC
ncbi:hypothetical protein IMZ48_09555 [Candidatus Bathyarchaeota archaeon]|nr:hypothetical protein [Candidatus Bathyarchaeota archaeon]